MTPPLSRLRELARAAKADRKVFLVEVSPGLFDEVAPDALLKLLDDYERMRTALARMEKWATSLDPDNAASRQEGRMAIIAARQVLSASLTALAEKVKE